MFLPEFNKFNFVRSTCSLTIFNYSENQRKEKQIIIIHVLETNLEYTFKFSKTCERITKRGSLLNSSRLL